MPAPRSICRALRSLLSSCLLLVATSVPAVTFAQAPDTTSADLQEAEQLMSTMQAAIDSVRGLVAQARGLDETRREAFRWQGQRLVQTLDATQDRLVDLVLGSRDAGRPLGDLPERFTRALETEQRLYRQVIARWSDELDDLRAQRETVPPGDAGRLELRISEARSALDRLFMGELRILSLRDSVGVTPQTEWDAFDDRLKSRADLLVGRLQLAVRERDLQTAQSGASRGQQDGPENLRLEIAKARVQGIAKSLGTMTDLMRERGMETALYRQFIIRSTGDVDVNLLDPEVLGGLLRDSFSDMWRWLGENVPRALISLGIVALFILAFQYGFRFVWWAFRSLGLVSLPRLAADLVGRMIWPFASLVGLFFGLVFLGINATALLAGAGVLGVIVGLALQESLSNIAAGAFILLTHPFDVDDVVRGGGQLGTVRALGITNTTIVTFDGRRLLIPNRRIWGEVIENQSVEPKRRAEVIVEITYESDAERAEKILIDMLREDERVLNEPPPRVFVRALAASGVEICVWPWVANADWWPVQSSLPRRIRERLGAEGIDIAYPHRVVINRHESHEG